MIRGNFRKLGAVLLAAAALGSPAKQAAAAISTAPVQTQNRQDQSGVVAETPQAVIQRQAKLRGFGGQMYHTSDVWRGTPKKGNRRHRSRWNYNR